MIVTCWACTRRCRFVAEKSHDTRAGLRANKDDVVFPFDDRLIDYPKHGSEFRLF